MAEYSAYASLNSLLKTKYVDKITDVIPPQDLLARRYPLKKKWNIGKELNIPVVVSKAQGVTYGGSDSGGYAIDTAISIETTNATVKTYSHALEGRVAQDLIDRMGQSPSDRSFTGEFALNVQTLNDQMSFHRELALLHGCAGIGLIKARTDDSGTTQTFSITARTWMPAMWPLILNGYIDVYSGATKRNAAGTLHVTAFSLANHTITLVGTEAEMDAITAGDMIYPKGAYGKWMQGMSYIAGSTALTIHGIDQASYPIWQSNLKSAGGSKLNYDLIAEAMVLLKGRGCNSPDLDLIIDPTAAKDIRTQLVAFEKKAPNSKRFDVNTDTLGFVGQDVHLVEHLYAKPGEALLVDPEGIDRIGKDVNFVDLGGGSKNYVMAVQGYNGAWYRCDFNQALVCRKPAFMLKINEIGSATA